MHFVIRSIVIVPVGNEDNDENIIQETHTINRIYSIDIYAEMQKISSEYEKYTLDDFETIHSICQCYTNKHTISKPIPIPWNNNCD